MGVGAANFMRNYNKNSYHSNNGRWRINYSLLRTSRKFGLNFNTGIMAELDLPLEHVRCAVDRKRAVQGGGTAQHGRLGGLGDGGRGLLVPV